MYWYWIALICVGLLIFGGVAAYVARLIIDYKEEKREQQLKKHLEQFQEELKQRAGPD